MTHLNVLQKALPAAHRYGLSIRMVASALLLRFAVAAVKAALLILLEHQRQNSKTPA